MQEEIDDKQRGDGDDASGGGTVIIDGSAGDGAHIYGKRVHFVAGEIYERTHKVVIFAAKRKYELRYDRGYGQRHYYMEEYSHIAEPVDTRAPEQIVGNPREVLAKEEHDARASEQHRNDERFERIRPVDEVEQQIARNKRDTSGNHHCQKKYSEQRFFAAEFEFRERIRRKRGHEHRYDGRKNARSERVKERADYRYSEDFGSRDVLVRASRHAEFRPPGKTERSRFVFRFYARDDNNVKRQYYDRGHNDEPEVRHDFLRAVRRKHVGRESVVEPFLLHRSADENQTDSDCERNARNDKMRYFLARYGIGGKNAEKRRENADYYQRAQDYVIDSV